MIVLKLLYSLIFPYCMGYAALRALLGQPYKLNSLFVAPLSFGLGLGLLSNGMLALNMLGIQYTLVNISLMQGVILALLLLIIFVRNKEKETVTDLLKFSPEKKMLDEGLFIKFLHIAFWAIAFYYLNFIFWRAMNIPVHEWDSLASSIYNAKVFYFDGNLAKLKWLPYSVYPLQLPLLCVWTSLCLGHWDEQYVKILFPLIFIAFTVIYYGFLRYWTGRAWAVLGTLFLFSSNLFVFHATLSYRDLFLSYYTCAAIMFLVLWVEKRQWVFLILVALLAGFGTFVKLEGVLYMVILSGLVFYLILRDQNEDLPAKVKTMLCFAIPCWSIFFLYYCFKDFNGISTVNYINPGLSGVFSRFNHSFFSFADALFFTANWNIFWGWLLFSIAFNLQTVRANRNIQLWLVILFLYVGFHFGLSFLLGISGHMLSPFTISRLFLHFFPLVPLLVVLINAKVFKPE
ncbi:MAG: hypothetical protein AB7S78_00645 [Candidatus Omnitrophota bacterium]